MEKEGKLDKNTKLIKLKLEEDLVKIQLEKDVFLLIERMEKLLKLFKKRKRFLFQNIQKDLFFMILFLILLELVN